MSGTENDKPEKAKRKASRWRLRENAGGLALTAALVLLLALGAGAALVGLAFLVIAMPLTTAAVAIVFAVAGIAAWRSRRRNS